MLIPLRRLLLYANSSDEEIITLCWFLWWRKLLLYADSSDEEIIALCWFLWWGDYCSQILGVVLFLVTLDFFPGWNIQYTKAVRQYLLLLHFLARCVGFTILGEVFAYETVFLFCFFFNPTIEVVTFHLCGWCMLAVFLLPAVIRLGHEHQDLLSLCHGMHVCTD